MHTIQCSGGLCTNTLQIISTPIELTRTTKQAFHINRLKQTQSQEEHIVPNPLTVRKSPTLAEICIKQTYLHLLQKRTK